MNPHRQFLSILHLHRFETADDLSLMTDTDLVYIHTKTTSNINSYTGILSAMLREADKDIARKANRDRNRDRVRETNSQAGRQSLTKEERKRQR